jgi:branched-chain amino acid transport system permease protein
VITGAEFAIASLLVGLVYVSISLGLFVSYGIMNEVDVPTLGYTLIGAYLALTLYERAGLDPVVSVPLVAAACYLVGHAVHVTTLTQMRGRGHLEGALVLFGVALVVEGFLAYTYGTDFRQVLPSYSDDALSVAGVRAPATGLVAGAIGATAALLLWLLIYRTHVGTRLLAVHGNPQAAELLGVNSAGVSRNGYALAAGFSGVGGVALALTQVIYPSLFLALAMIAFTIVIAGGRRSFWGLVVASLILAFATNGMLRFGSAAWSQVIPFGFLVALLLLRPTGVLGSRERTI